MDMMSEKDISSYKHLRFMRCALKCNIVPNYENVFTFYFEVIIFWKGSQIFVK